MQDSGSAVHTAGLLPDGALDTCAASLYRVHRSAPALTVCASGTVGRLDSEGSRGLRWSTMIARLVYGTRIRRRQTAPLPPHGRRAALQGGAPLRMGEGRPLLRA